MSEKKGDIKAFLAKQKKGKKGKTAEPTAEAGPTAAEEVIETTKEAPVVQKEEKKVPDQGKNAESSEDEEDNANLAYGVIQDKIASDKPKEKVDFFADQADQKQAASGTAASSQSKGPSEIKFGGGKPKFGRGKGGIGGGFNKGLDDLDDDAGDDGNNDQNANDDSGPGGRQFVNLSSAPRVAGGNQEEEKRDSRPAAVKPTFRGKANLKGTGGGQEKDQDSAGGNRTYDFAVAFRGQGGDEKRERTEENKQERSGEAQRGGGRGRRGGRGGGRGGFGPSQAQQDEDEGFEVVRGGRKPKNRQNNDDSDSDEAPAQGGGRGGRGRGGRGGFFTNSGKNRIQD